MKLTRSTEVLFLSLLIWSNICQVFDSTYNLRFNLRRPFVVSYFNLLGSVC